MNREQWKMLAEQWRDEGGCYPDSIPPCQQEPEAEPEPVKPARGSVVAGALSIIGFGALFGFGAAAGASLWGVGEDFDEI